MVLKKLKKGGGREPAIHGKSIIYGLLAKAAGVTPAEYMKEREGLLRRARELGLEGGFQFVQNGRIRQVIANREYALEQQRKAGNK